MHLGLSVTKHLDDNLTYVLACVHWVIEEKNVIHLVFAQLVVSLHIRV